MKIIKLLTNWFMWCIHMKSDKPQERVLYAVTNGTMLGVCVLFINPKEYPKSGHYAAIAIGDKNMDGGMDAIDIPEKDVINGIKLGILERVTTFRKIPRELYELCCSEYAERVKRKEEIKPDESTN